MERTYYEFDENGVYTGSSTQIDQYGTWPKNSTFLAPPSVADGEYAVFVDGAWSVQQNKPMQPLIEKAYDKLCDSCNHDFEVLKNGYPDRETQSWSVQLKEAESYLSDNATPTPFISAALKYGETVEQYANLIIANNAQWSAYAGAVVRKRREYEARIEAANTSEEIEQIISEL